MIDYSKVISVLRPGVPFLVNGDEYEGIKMLDDSEPPTKAECDAAWYAVVVEKLRVEKINAQILDLEKQAIEQGLIRTIIDDLLARSVALAAQSGVVAAQLLDPTSEHYSPAFAKVYANAEARNKLRAQR